MRKGALAIHSTTFILNQTINNNNNGSRLAAAADEADEEEEEEEEEANSNNNNMRISISCVPCLFRQVQASNDD